MIIGIDTGAKGAAVAMLSDGRIIDELRFACATTAELVAMLAEHKPRAVYVERVNVMGAGMRGNAHTAFKQGVGYGTVIGVVMGLGLRLVDVTPSVWQRGVGLPGVAKEEGSAHKRRLRELAQRLLAGRGLKIVADNCDAALIAEYGRMVER